MNDVNQHILDAIKVHVWGGFDAPEDVQELISDLLEEGADEEMLRKQVNEEFIMKQNAEASWPVKTDMDRLKRAFNALEDKGILCLHNAGYTLSDGHDDAHEAIVDYPQGKFFGYCFYHEQDIERAVFGEGLMLAYDHVDGDTPDKLQVAVVLKEELEKVGFIVVWDGTTDQRIGIPAFDWKHRT